MAQYGARSKTTTNNSRRQRQNSSSVNSKSDDGWGEIPVSPRGPATFDGIWDSVLPDSPPSNPMIENAWGSNREKSWSKRNQNRDNGSTYAHPRRSAWPNSEAEFPPLEASKPVVNVWKVREEKFRSKKAMEPTNENEEQRMIRQAMELSKIEAERDEQKRRELEEEYKMQMLLMETNPLLFEEFRTDEEIAAALSEFPTEEDSCDDNYFPTQKENRTIKEAPRKPSHEESYGRDKEVLQNRKQPDLTLPSSKSRNTSHAGRKPISDSENKAKINKTVNMFGGWGQKAVSVESEGLTDTKSNLPAKNKGANESTVSKKNNNVSEVSKNSLNEGSKSGVNMQSKYHPNGKANTDSFKSEKPEDFGWLSDTDTSKFERKDKDEDIGWMSNNSGPVQRPKNAVKTKTDEKPYSVKQKHFDRSEDSGWQSDTDTSEFERKNKDEDSGWISQNPAPVQRPKNTVKTKTEEKTYSVKPKHLDRYEDSGWQSDTHVSEFETKIANEDSGWISENPAPTQGSKNTNNTKEEKLRSVKKNQLDGSEDFGWQSQTDVSEFEAKGKCDDSGWTSGNTDPRPGNPIKRDEKASSVKQKYSMEPISNTIAKNGDLAESIISEYVNLTSNCETASLKEYQNKEISFERKQSTEKVFDLLHKDYVNGNTHSQRSPSDTLWITASQSLPGEPQPMGNSSKLPVTNPGTTNTNRNDVSYSSTSVSKDASGSSIPYENALPVFPSPASETSDSHSQNHNYIGGDGTSLTSLASSQSSHNNFSSSQPQFAPSQRNDSSSSFDPPMSNPTPTLNPYPESLSAHFQQFQPHPTPIAPAFMNPALMMNPLLMQQMMSYPVMPEIMLNYYKSLGAVLPMFPQGMLGIPNFQPFMNVPRAPPVNIIDPPIPPPNPRSDLERNNELPLSGPEASYGNDGWLDQFLNDPQINATSPIPPPVMPQNGASGGSALNFSPAASLSTKNHSVDSTSQARSASKDDSRWLDEGGVAYPDASNDDWGTEIPNAMRDSSRYVAENKENRQPARRPFFCRDLSNSSSR